MMTMVYIWMSPFLEQVHLASVKNDLPGFSFLYSSTDRLCGVAVRVSGLGSILGTTTFSEK
jgi:hypothetical protein